jgi:hypothetical protein
MFELMDADQASLAQANREREEIEALWKDEKDKRKATQRVSWEGGREGGREEERRGREEERRGREREGRGKEREGEGEMGEGGMGREEGGKYRGKKKEGGEYFSVGRSLHLAQVGH